MVLNLSRDFGSREMMNMGYAGFSSLLAHSGREMTDQYFAGLHNNGLEKSIPVLDASRGFLSSSTCAARTGVLFDKYKIETNDPVPLGISNADAGKLFARRDFHSMRDVLQECVDDFEARIRAGYDDNMKLALSMTNLQRSLIVNATHLMAVPKDYQRQIPNNGHDEDPNSVRIDREEYDRMMHDANRFRDLRRAIQ